MRPFVRSPYAHAKILNIDTTAAKASDGVKLVMTGAELAAMCTAPWVGTLTVFDNMKAEPQYPMAVDRACWHGEPVVMIVAETRAQAEDAGELIQIKYEELPVVIRKEKALLPDSPVIHPNLGDNIAWVKTLGSGDVDKAFTEADHVLEETFEFGRHTAVSLESRVVLCEYDPGTERLVIHTSSQCPHMIETVFARTLGIAEHNVRIVAPRCRWLVRPEDSYIWRRSCRDGGVHETWPPREVRRRPSGILRVRHPRPRKPGEGQDWLHE